MCFYFTESNLNNTRTTQSAVPGKVTITIHPKK